MVVPEHTPAEHVSFAVQALLSSQEPVLLACTQPVDVLQESSVQALPSSQLRGAAPAMQAPPAHISPVVHALPSSQAIVLLVLTHAPVFATQVSVVQTLLSLQRVAASEQRLHPVAVLHVPVEQITAAPGTQAPPKQVSGSVQALLSLQGSALFVYTQPVAVLHVSVVQTLLSSQLVAVCTQPVPVLHVSVVQALVSAQSMAVYTQPVAGLQVSVVQALLSLQTTAVPDWQVPPAQASPVVQASLSEHAAVLLVNTHPVAVLQESSVQALLSLQVIAPC